MLESKRKAIIFIVLSVLLAVTAGFLVLKKVQALNTNLGTSVKIYVASKEISSRSLITPENVMTDEIPKKFLKSYHITNVDELVNKVSVVPLSEGDVITKNILKQASSVVDENNRLITLMQNERVFFDEPLEALDRVDIIVSHRFNGKEETSVFMKDVKVARTAKKDNKFKGVQLEVSIDKAPELIHMQNYADSLRVIKANVGKQEASENAEETEKENPPAEAKQAEQKKPAEEPKKEEKPKEEQKPSKPEEKPKQQ
ncbi:flagella basal body P-ring formation protein FlgA [Bacillus sp. es.034]|uniref:Flp pilus assembly protein CpaB n=1 Tax=Bacillus sp. es.034 TaxID=1761763 RepID=UPI000BF83DEF|nr:flagella basal body P-ring formation protein FlgA [Bacillus sp. es.034]PFG03904.1 pilus assembly protein CpaB [Bacillus sp. es.034]